MSITTHELDAPSVYAVGYKVSSTGHTTFFHDYLDNQITPGGTPESVTNVAPLVFADFLVLYFDTPDDADLRSYWGELPTLTNIVGMLPESPTTGAGNILYNLGTKMPSPTSARFFAYPYPIIFIAPDTAIPDGISVWPGNIITTDDVTIMTAAVFAKGQVGLPTVIKFKLA